MSHALPDRLSPGSPYPLGASWDGLGVNFAVFSANAQQIELCLFDPTGRKEMRRYHAARMHRRNLARLPAQRASRHRLRLSRAWPVSAAERASLQSAQAVARPVCAQAGRAVSLVRCAVQLPRAFEPARPVHRPARFGAGHAEMRRDRRGLRLVARQAAERAVGRNRHLRNARARRVDAAPRFARSTNAARSRRCRRRNSSSICKNSA